MIQFKKKRSKISHANFTAIQFPRTRSTFQAEHLQNRTESFVHLTVALSSKFSPEEKQSHEGKDISRMKALKNSVAKKSFLKWI